MSRTVTVTHAQFVPIFPATEANMSTTRLAAPAPAPIADPAAAFAAILAALGLRPSGDTATDVDAADVAYANIIDAIDPAAQAQLGARLGLSAREITACSARGLDVRAYHRTRAGIKNR